MKHRRLFIFASLMMTFALSACSNPFLPNLPTSRNDVNSNNSGNGDYSSNEHTHSWKDWEIIKDPTCKEEGEKHRYCEICGYEEFNKISALNHTWSNWEINAESSCLEGGYQTRHCLNCGEKETKSIPAKGHTWSSWTNIEQPTCEEPGSRKHYCTICGQDEVCEIAALGHNYSLYDYSSPEDGKAEVRLYKCANGCGSASLSFNVSEVTSHSDGLVYESPYEVGARFWGRPIGNKMELDENGNASARPDDLAAIYDPTVYGDCFEYKFDLTAKQVAAMGETCLLYCDAQPADYLGGQDFWACDPSAEEWTPGFYIEGDKAGQVIEDYRYILYVDDTPVEFDPTMKAPVSNGAGGGQWGMGGQTNLPRGEFVMPYKFHLHEGTNKISLRMAGGYRSLFYNFTFRTVEAEEPVHAHTWVDGTKVEKTKNVSAYTPGTCECGKNRVLVDVASDLNGKLTAKGQKLGANNDVAKYVFPMASAKAAQVMIKVAPDQSGNLRYGFHTGKNGGSSAVDLPDGKTNTTFTVNGIALTIPAGSYQDLGATGTTEDRAALVDLGIVDLVAGYNEFTIERTDSYAPYYFEIMFVY